MSRIGWFVPTDSLTDESRKWDNQYIELTRDEVEEILAEDLEVWDSYKDKK